MNADKENLIFFVLLFILAVIVILIIGWIFAKIVRTIRKMIAVAFNLEVKKPRFDKKESTEWLHQKGKQHFEEFLRAPIQPSAQPITSVNSIKEKEEKSIEEGLKEIKSRGSALKLEQPGQGEIKIPIPSHKPESASSNKNPIEILISKNQKSSDASIFDGKQEISRQELRQKLRYDPKVWKAGVQSKFDLTREERVKLEKEIFPSIYGRNISKADMNRRIRMMIKERGSASNLEKAETLRREIKFLKKIGGVK